MEVTMRVLSCALAMIACLAAPSYAQDETPGAAYVEFGGTAMFYSINGEVPVARSRTVRIGAMLLPHLVGATTSINQLVGSGESRVVLGLGLTFVGSGNDRLTAGTATIGYRHTRRNGSFFQLAATPFITKRGVHRYAGISFGKSY
jgi:hypothetical protein